MSIFSRISRSKKAAQEAKGKAAEKEEKEEAVVKAPYKHVPTHAAQDALIGIPSSWRADDLVRIKEQNKRRSQMVNSRAGSLLSTVSYTAAGPSTQQQNYLPRNSSYSGYSPAWSEQRDQGSYFGDLSQKRHKLSKGHAYHDSGVGGSIGPSPLANVSPVISSGNSTSSNLSDPLDVGPNEGHNRKRQRPQAHVFPESDIFKRLHTSTTRKVGEAPVSVKTSPVEPLPQNVLSKNKEGAQEQNQVQKKKRWSIMGRKTTPAIGV